MDSFAWLRPTVERVVDRVRALGADVPTVSIGTPAKKADLQKAEKRIGCPLPKELAALFRTFSAKFSLRWQLDLSKNPDADPSFEGLLWGEFSGSLRDVRVVSANDYWWAEEIVAGTSSGEWFKKLHLQTAGDGDFLAYGLEARIANKPVFVPHDATRWNYLVMGDTLEEFLKNWSRTGFLMINTFRQFQDRTIERIPWSAYDKVIRFLDIPPAR